MMNILKIISACNLDIDRYFFNLMIKCHIFLYIISYDIISAIELKKTCCTGKSLGHLFSQVLYIYAYFLGVYFMMLHLPLSFFLARPMQHLESISAKFI